MVELALPFLAHKPDANRHLHRRTLFRLELDALPLVCARRMGRSCILGWLGLSGSLLVLMCGAPATPCGGESCDCISLRSLLAGLVDGELLLNRTVSHAALSNRCLVDVLPALAGVLTCGLSSQLLAEIMFGPFWTTAALSSSDFFGAASG